MSNSSDTVSDMIFAMFFSIANSEENCIREVDEKMGISQNWVPQELEG